MEEIISYELAEQKPSLEYTSLCDNDLPVIFAGHIVNSKYDEKRLNIKDASRLIFETVNKDYHLYGTYIKPSRNNHFINELQLAPPTNLNDYNKLLSRHELSCFDCFLHFSPGIYPIDLTHKDYFFNDLDLNTLLSKNKNIATFQQAGSIYLLALINIKS
jgi:hypothetical protein